MAVAVLVEVFSIAELVCGIGIGIDSGDCFVDTCLGNAGSVGIDDRLDAVFLPVSECTELLTS
jgi:hypothetical protein